MAREEPEYVLQVYVNTIIQYRYFGVKVVLVA